jgi:hypothetical protein
MTPNRHGICGWCHRPALYHTGTQGYCQFHRALATAANQRFARLRADYESRQVARQTSRPKTDHS